MSIGFTFPQVTTRHGKRCSSYNAFLEGAKSRSNLEIATFALVQKILIDDSNLAYGVQYRRHDRILTAKATREIILSAGAIGSPQILMLSGIGPEYHLKNLGVMSYNFSSLKVIHF